MSYVKGTVYRIICLTHPGIQYIGSTFNQLRWRWQSHKKDYKQYLKGIGGEISIFPYFTELGIENFKIIKIKDYIVYAEHKLDKKHLSVYEQLWINKLKCVNKIAAFNPLLITSPDVIIYPPKEFFNNIILDLTLPSQKIDDPDTKI